MFNDVRSNHVDRYEEGVVYLAPIPVYASWRIVNLTKKVKKSHNCYIQCKATQAHILNTKKLMYTFLNKLYISP